VEISERTTKGKGVNMIITEQRRGVCYSKNSTIMTQQQKKWSSDARVMFRVSPYLCAKRRVDHFFTWLTQQNGEPIEPFSVYERKKIICFLENLAMSLDLEARNPLTNYSKLTVKELLESLWENHHVNFANKSDLGSLMGLPVSDFTG